MSTKLISLLQQAEDHRAALLETLHAENTDSYRLFHGSVEGCPGLTIDRYNDLLLVQSFHQSLTPEEQTALRDYYQARYPEAFWLYNDRSQSNSRISNPLAPHEQEQAEAIRQAHEMGIRFHISGRHSGQDPWLFLDLRATRRRVRELAEGKTVLNLFAYTCGVGLAAAKGGAHFVLNVDFAESSLAVGRANAKLNDLATRPRCLQSDVFAAIRQLSGLGQPKMVRGKKMPPFPVLEARQFDLVLLDPPRYAKSPFGVVDLVNDYQALFKPALLATAPGGKLICCNNVAQVDKETWLNSLMRCAEKAGRPISNVEWILPEADFPSSDDNPPLKTVILDV